MIRLKEFKTHHIAAFFLITFILSFIIGRLIIVQERDRIFKKGLTSVCKVYQVHYDGQVDIYDGDYFFFHQKKKYYGNYIIKKHNIKPIGKYYQVFFLSKKPHKSAVDYTREVHPDSVKLYFPHGQNPFEEKIKLDSITRLRSNSIRQVVFKAFFGNSHINNF